MIEYSLDPLPFRGLEGMLRGTVHHAIGISQGRLIDYMAAIGTTVTKTDILAVKRLECEAVRHFLLLGHTVNMDICNIGLSIGGVFNSDDDQFDEKHHTVRVWLSPGKFLNTLTSKDFELKKIYSDNPHPSIKDLFDFKSKTENKILTPGGEARITGNDLKFSTDDSDLGIFIIPERKKIEEIIKSDGNGPQRKEIKYIQGKEIKVPTDDIHLLTESRIFFCLPVKLTAGKYNIEIRKSYGKEILRSAFKNGFRVRKINKSKSAKPTVVKMYSKKKK